MARCVVLQLIWSQTSWDLLPSPRLCPRRSPTSESGSPGPLAPCISEPTQETAHAGLITRARTILFFERRGSKGHSFWARERLTFPPADAKAGQFGNGASFLAEGAGMLLSPSAAPLFSGGLPRLETIKCCFSVHMWQQVGPRMKPLPTQSLHPCRLRPNCVLP